MFDINEVAREAGTDTAKGRDPRQATEQKKVRYAVVGLGYISQVAVLPAFKNAEDNSELVALVSSDTDKLKKLARKYRVSKTYTYERYKDCLASGEIDAVYIALPNNMHREYAEAAANAGAHILCEKPMALTEEECQSMIAAADRANVKLMVAYRLHFEAGNLGAIRAVNEDKIGKPRIFRSAFCQQVVEGNSRLDFNLGRGPIYDVGIYCINAARYLFRAEPEEVFAFAGSGAGDPRFKDVPEMTSVLMRFPEDRVAEFTCSFGAADRSAYEVIGTKGVLKMDPAYEMVGDLKCEITIAGRTEKSTFKKRDQFGPELVYFSNCILQDKQPEPNGQEGLADVRIIQAILESVEQKRAIQIHSVENLARPSEDQEIHKPAVEKPELTKAAAPSQN